MNSPASPPLLTSDYARKDCAIGIVHVGFGAFHRAHQAVYIDAYMQATRDLRWGIAAVNLRGSEAAGFARAATAPDGYVLKTMSPHGATEYRLIRPHIAFADWSDDAAAAENLCALDTVSIISITVTESGYYFDDAGALNREDPRIAAELRGEDPRSVYAYLTAALTRRKAAGAGPVSILCCDNIRGNGHMLRRNLAAYMQALGADDLADWVAQNVSFPCSMVDRITPKPTAADAAETAYLFRREGDQTVMAEDFIQWVIEDNFAAPRPVLEQVGVTITADVDPFEEAKIRILNGGHTALTYLAALSGHHTFDQAIADPQLCAHFDRFETQEVLPALDMTLPFDKTAYLAKIADRFGNSNIGDTVERICADGYAKFPVFIRPTLAGCFARGITPTAALRSIAGWYVFARRAARGLTAQSYLEPNQDALAPLIADGNLSGFANSEALWADLPARHPEFISLLQSSIQEVEITWPE